MLFDYDKTDMWSILEYSKRLLGKSLEQAVAPTIVVPKRGKGGLGQLVEVYFFGIKNNSRQEADFPEAGVELKVTPLKLGKNEQYEIKERLVCTMIDFTKDQKRAFADSHIVKKCSLMLIPFYLHLNSIPVQKLRFIYDVLWQIPDKDLLIMKHDYETIIGKIKAGKAHEISEGDTMYLGACRKGQKGDKAVYYKLPDGSTASTPAPKRAFALKVAYMKTILEFAKKTGGQGSFNTSALAHGYTKHLIEEEELEEKSFEEILLDRFKPFYGMSYDELVEEMNASASGAKSKYFLIANAILTDKGERGIDVTASEEFLKSGIVMKTIRLNKNGRPVEAMSFENIKYGEVMSEKNWYGSRLYELFTQRFLFIVFQEDEFKVERLKKAFFWTMPVEDLSAAALYWQSIRQAIRDNHISSEYFYKESEHKKFHVRPKGTKQYPFTDNPHGGKAKKLCYWFNHDYVKEIVDKSE